MCGIIGIAAASNVAEEILGGLKQLEYRGYDSAGIATISDGTIRRARAQGKLRNLEQLVTSSPLPGQIGIGHTRWATHGAPNETNAHPHATSHVAVVHNGIIENFRQLREELSAKGHIFSSQTDTEVVPALVTDYLQQGLSPKDAVFQSLRRLEGAYALAFIFADAPDTLIAARQGPPLAVGYGDGENFIGSDAIALAHLTSRIAYLEDGDYAVITAKDAQIFDRENRPANRAIIHSAYGGGSVGKDNYRHFMQKEIFEQPGVFGEAVKFYCNPLTLEISLGDLGFALENVEHVQLVACGTSFYAAQVAKYWLEDIAHVRADIDIASEYRYRTPVMHPRGITVVISQSGETADTLAVLRYAKPHQPVLGIVNAPQSSIAREATGVLYTHAGPEIGVASTKAFTSQLATLACFTLALAQKRGAIDETKRKTLCSELLEVPTYMTQALALNDQLQALSHNLIHSRSMLYMGRGTSYPIAMEGALKMKEISYIHAEAYAAGELKHGPIALIDEDTPVVVLAPSDAMLEKTASNAQEVAARGGRIILFCDRKGVAAIGDIAVATKIMPETDPFTAPIIYALPMQLLAYHVAVLKGTDVDQPRNLAKSVTVE